MRNVASKAVVDDGHLDEPYIMNIPLAVSTGSIHAHFPACILLDVPLNLSVAVLEG